MIGKEKREHGDFEFQKSPLIVMQTTLNRVTLILWCFP
jgi:hypothetical protein